MKYILHEFGHSLIKSNRKFTIIQINLYPIFIKIAQKERHIANLNEKFYFYHLFDLKVIINSFFDFEILFSSLKNVKMHRARKSSFRQLKNTIVLNKSSIQCRFEKWIFDNYTLFFKTNVSYNSIKKGY
ncbi:hypothetical protein BpHYR1_019880 [Brachionus plicatilis]|uniref:Uncharacterized protein n=1 Tax=Brachionus plicatilis TaxID=10195 RepID=A0A3M7TA58_BRAPC|nr:hypothetical protein BpHYR1_019880 [Brachionus plicatilis]